MITVRVGQEPNEKDFLAHESYLTTQSEFFRRALHGKLQKAESRIVKLPEDDPEIFGLYLNYVYTGHLPTTCEAEKDLTAHYLSLMDEYHQLFSVYVMAEKLLNPDAKNAAMTALVEIWTRNPGLVVSARTVYLVYEGTPGGSRARRFVVDGFVQVPFWQVLMTTRHDNLGAFRNEIALALDKLHGKPHVVSPVLENYLEAESEV